MGDSWDDIAAEWDSNPDVIAYAQHAFDSLVAVADVSGSRVLDLGCGTGQLTARLAPRAAHVVAIDPAPRMIAVLAAKQLPTVSPLCGTLADLLVPEPVAAFDLVVASSVCAFVPDYPEVLRHVHALLQAGGHFVQWDWLSAQGDTTPGFTEAEVRTALVEAGFSSVTVTTPFAMNGPSGTMPVLMGVARK